MNPFAAESGGQPQLRAGVIERKEIDVFAFEFEEVAVGEHERERVAVAGIQWSGALGERQRDLRRDIVGLPERRNIDQGELIEVVERTGIRILTGLFNSADK